MPFSHISHMRRYCWHPFKGPYRVGSLSESLGDPLTNRSHLWLVLLIILRSFTDFSKIIFLELEPCRNSIKFNQGVNQIGTSIDWKLLYASCSESNYNMGVT